MPTSTDASIWTGQNLDHALEAAGVALWSWNVDTDRLTMDAKAFLLWDLPQSAEITFEELSTRIHPADRDRVRAAFSATRTIIGAYETDFRILVGETVRWISARGQGDDSGIVQRVMFGIFLDVTGRKQAEESHELLAGEMSHRLKNLLAIASGLTSITARSTTSSADMAQMLIHRLAALGRAHDLVRPTAGRKDAALVGDLFSVLLAPYEDMGNFTGRIRVSVPRMAVGEGAATTIALVVHELATNSLKYGALSVERGSLDISSAVDGDEVTVIWTERGGPAVAAPSGAGGFGSKLVQRSLSGQMAGSINYEWLQAGVVVTLKMSKKRLSQ